MSERDGQWWDAMFADMTRLREQYGFVSLSVGEADPREAGPPSLALGMREDGQLLVAVVDETVGPFEATTRDEFRRLWPHCKLQFPAGSR